MGNLSLFIDESPRFDRNSGLGGRFIEGRKDGVDVPGVAVSGGVLDEDFGI